MTYKQYAAQMRGYMQEPMFEQEFNKMMNIGKEEETPALVIPIKNKRSVVPILDNYSKVQK